MRSVSLGRCVQNTVAGRTEYLAQNAGSVTVLKAAPSDGLAVGSAAARPRDLRVGEATAAPPPRPAGFQAVGQARIARRDDARLAARRREISRATPRAITAWQLTGWGAPAGLPKVV